ncbi:hypothetical protein Taro_010380 [Colocasia esculenta]|uniref:Uncharacterized protein n=1 Tax=Colocasia esculenta TaxID=4460 RepID=A0A843TYS0_COLES|nr:hypothetical protein [Colocasia esculenta]
MAADYWLAAIPLDADPDRRPPPWTNIVNVTVELSSFGRPKKEKLEPHLCQLREATTTTWSKYFLGHRVESRYGSMDANSQLATTNVAIYFPELVRSQIWKRLRFLRLLFWKLLSNGAGVSTSSEEIVRSDSEREE